jgi:NADH-quinone oxidoreductase subunit L
MPDQFLIGLIIFLPLLAFILCQLIPTYKSILACWLFNIITAMGFFASLTLYFINAKLPQKTLSIPWFSFGEKHFFVSVLFDTYTYILLIVVHFISILVGIFSTEYMKNDKALNRYFGFIALFIFSMIGVLLSGSLFQIYFFWELVGFCSYLLIGFWYDKKSAVNASLKAFLINRIGDVCFLIGIFMCFKQYGTTDLQTINSIVNIGQNQTIIGLLIFGGCVAKSAQFPLHTWLPDAMEGPTPVSALIHAATMVAAGIYLIIRAFPIFTENALAVITIIGCISMLMGGVKAIFQSDIKKVLAYSTISQLGLMVVAVGIGMPSLAFLHLIMHAFFKAGLFLCAGSVIHAIHESDHSIDAQNMYLMGGLRAKLPITFWSFVISAASLMGLPLLSGFLSKDQIIEAAYHFNGFGGKIFFVCLLISSFLTAFYMSRQLWLVFAGQSRSNESLLGIKEQSGMILIPIILLAILSTQLIGYILVVPPFSINLLAIISTIFAFSGILMAFFFRKKLIDFPIYKSKFDLYYNNLFVKNTLTIANLVNFIDVNIIDGFVRLVVSISTIFSNISKWIDTYLVDGFVNNIAKFSKNIGTNAQKLQSGQFQWYVSIMMLILLLIFTFLGKFLN